MVDNVVLLIVRGQMCSPKVGTLTPETSILSEQGLPCDFDWQYWQVEPELTQVQASAYQARQDLRLARCCGSLSIHWWFRSGTS